MHRKTILHLTGMTSTKFGGLEHYFVELVRLCNKKGYQSILQYDCVPQSLDYLLHLEKLGAKIVIYDTHGNLLQASLKIASLIHSVRPKVVQTHFMGYRLRFVVGIAGRLLGVPKTIAMIHSYPDLKKNTLKRFTYNNYHQVLAVSGAIADNLIYGGVKSKIVSTHYLGLFGNYEKSEKLKNKIREEFGISEQMVVMACIAFDSPLKGLDILLEAFAKVAEKHKQITLILIGAEPSQSIYPQMADELGLSKYIKWAGIRDEAWRILNAADIYIQPSRSEGLPLAILEAMSFKLPVVATRVGGIPEAVVDGETGYLADFANAESLSDAIEKMLVQPEKWRIMGKAGYFRYQQLFKGKNSIKTLVERYYKV